MCAVGQPPKFGLNVSFSVFGGRCVDSLSSFLGLSSFPKPFDLTHCELRGMSNVSDNVSEISAILWPTVGQCVHENVHPNDRAKWFLARKEVPWTEQVLDVCLRAVDACRRGGDEDKLHTQFIEELQQLHVVVPFIHIEDGGGAMEVMITFR